MKSKGVALAFALLALGGQTAFSQGTVSFDTSFLLTETSSVRFDTRVFSDSSGLISFLNPGVNPEIDLIPIDTTPGIIRPGGSSSYNTGSSLTANRASGTPAQLRSQGFEASAYFNSGSQNYDPSFALRLGNGVDPRMGGGFDISAVPEPSALALGALAALGLAARRFLRRRP